MVIVRMRRRRAPIQPHVTPSTASASTPPLVGLDRGRPPPSPPPPEQARIFVYRLMLSGASREQIAEMDTLNVPPFGRQIVYRIYADVCKELGNAAELPENTRENLRAQATERLRRELVQLRVRRETPKLPIRDYVNLTREVRFMESLLADVEGTKQLEIHVGVDVDVRVRSASMRIIANLTRDELATMGREVLDGRRRS